MVSRTFGEPIGYAPEQVHAALKERAAVIEDAGALRPWLGAHPAQTRCSNARRPRRGDPTRGRSATLDVPRFARE